MKPNLIEKLNSIREVIDMPICDDIDSIKGKGAKLAGIIGLSAECKAQAENEYKNAQLLALTEIEAGRKEYPPSVLIKVIEMKCAKESKALVYADRLNAAVTHSLDYIRSLISWEKQERINENNANFVP